MHSVQVIWNLTMFLHLKPILSIFLDTKLRLWSTLQQNVAMSVLDHWCSVVTDQVLQLVIAELPVFALVRHRYEISRLQFLILPYLSIKSYKNWMYWSGNFLHSHHSNKTQEASPKTFSEIWFFIQTKALSGIIH